MAYFVGLDSGGTKTECWLGDERQVLARSVCPTVKLTRVSQEVAMQRLRGLLAEVSLASGVRLGAVERTCVGAAGLSIAEVREWVTRVVGVVWAKMREHCERMGKVAYTGSVVEKMERVRRQMERRIVQRCAGWSVMSGAVNSMEGAMWRARGGKADPPLREG